MDIISIKTYLLNQLTSNQFAIAGTLSAAAYWIIGYLKPIPSFLYSRINRLFLYKVSIEQSDELYNYVSQYLADKFPNKLRNVEAFVKEYYNNDPYYDDEDLDSIDEDRSNKNVKIRHYTDFIIVRYGWNFIKFKKTREKLENANNFDKAYLGRYEITGILAKKLIVKLLNDIVSEYKISNKNDLYILKYSPGSYESWTSSKEYTCKTVENIIFPERDSILKSIDKFNESKNIYIPNGIEWYYGLTLYGKPGSGKTTFAKALAKYTKRDLYVINLPSITDSKYMSLFNSIGKNALLLIDDIDIGINDRESTNKNGVQLSTLLSTLDGNSSRSDLIVVFTTNNIKALDDALLRHGRMDKVIEVSYPDNKCINEYLSNFYGTKYKEYINNTKISVPMSTIQDVCLKNDLETAVSIIQNEKY